MGKQNIVHRQTIIAMKGHPGTGKSTLAQSIAKILKCPLIDKDHFRDCTKPIQQPLMKSSPNQALTLLNELSYDAMWHAARTQLELGLNVIVVSPLSRVSRFERLIELGERFGARIVIIECKPKDLELWRLRVENRAKVEKASAWHKPATWDDMEKVFENCYDCDYDVGDVPKLVVDTTGAQGVQGLIPSVLEFLNLTCSSGNEQMSPQVLQELNPRHYNVESPPLHNLIEI